jgi:hypothetical protein
MSSAARHAMAMAICALVFPLASCASVGSAASGGRPSVVAAENVWGSIAAQLGGDRVTVTSIIDNPNADPHDYEPTTEDERADRNSYRVPSSWRHAFLVLSGTDLRSGPQTIMGVVLIVNLAAAG